MDFEWDGVKLARVKRQTRKSEVVATAQRLWQTMPVSAPQLGGAAPVPGVREQCHSAICSWTKPGRFDLEVGDLDSILWLPIRHLFIKLVSI